MQTTMSFWRAFRLCVSVMFSTLSLMGGMKEAFAASVLVTTTAGILQKDGMIRYSRGHITALDRTKLEMRVCECYAAIKRETDRLIQQNPQGVSHTRKPLPLSRKPAALVYTSVQITDQQCGTIANK